MRNELRHAEIGNLREAIFVDAPVREHDVRGLDIAVNNSLAVRIVERFRQLAQNGDQVIARRQRIALHGVFERRPIDKLHEDVGEVVAFENVVNRNDVGVRELAGRLSFAEHAFAQIAALVGIGKFTEANRLDGDSSPNGRIERPIDDATSAATQLFQDLIPADLVHFFSV